MSGGLLFVDTETTGLDPDRHEVWDIAIVEENGIAHEWHVRPARGKDAEPTALRMTNFYQRTAAPGWRWDDPVDVAQEVALLTAGRHIAGAVPSFDDVFLSRFLRSFGQREAWHYHLLDVEVYLAGHLHVPPPWDSKELAQRVGIEPPTPAHTAIGDALWAKQMYEAVLFPELAAAGML